jgi:hypothetical protein
MRTCWQMLAAPTVGRVVCPVSVQATRRALLPPLAVRGCPPTPKLVEHVTVVAVPALTK